MTAMSNLPATSQHCQHIISLERGGRRPPAGKPRGSFCEAVERRARALGRPRVSHEPEAGPLGPEPPPHMCAVTTAASTMGAGLH